MFPQIQQGVSEQDVIGVLAKALSGMADTQKHTTPTGTPSLPYTHGPGGLFGVSGLERDLFHTRISGRGLAWALPTIATDLDTPLFAYITGFQDVSGSVADGVCDDPEIAGPMKSCIQSAPLGRYSFMTREMEINRVGLRNNRGEFDDLRVLNDPLVPELGKTIFPSISGNSQIAAGAEVLSRFLELGVAFVNRLGRQVYIGNPANNSAGGGSQEFQGLDILIGTAKVDVFQQTACPTLYSDVKDFNYSLVDDPDANPNIVTTVTMLWRFVNHNASQMSMNPVTWAFTMRQALFWEITDIWACAYWSHRCATEANTNTTNTAQIDARGQTEFRDAMRNGRYLVIDGTRVPVIIDDFIVEETSDENNAISVGCFASDIYLIPMTALGGRPVTFWHYYDYAAGPMSAVRDGRLGDFFWTDGGRYLWHTKPPLNWCVQWVAKCEPRIIMLTPHLAGVITNVQYCPLQHEREVHPDDPYFVDGGVTDRPAPSLWFDWNAGPQGGDR